ncbi:hypothetical protein C7974DRAFT_391094 [Boeremia exigua]|uniref:uncharacterized protein n=1 Tax=Boeremia exigua TaxID=749465 RepID=UPI001E8CEBE5|nr:uncharacterized protein C7974DRAFT_391094 [Boeremia exigua]KAH6638217.1 hypothetical protein C7974DRAFT_391094 [Boeremia exigua]
MTLSDTYKRFLDRPSQGDLAEKVALHYITTLTSINDSAAIIKHLQIQEKLLKKTKQQVVSVVEGRHALSVDVETTIEFLNGGGAYLPGLDDNFVADRTVTFPMVHIVHFDSADKITQIRQYWDQGSLLKQIDVIGARSRNWPIREGPEQAKLIKSSAQTAQPDSAPSSRPSTASRGADEVSIRSRGSTSNAMNDPHASLSLFERRQIEENELPSAHPTAPRVQSAKPPPREYSELFVGENTGSPSTQQQRFPVKAGANKQSQVNRLFDETDEDRIAATTPLKATKTNPKKFNHFEFGDGESEKTPRGRDASRKEAPRGNSKSQANWNFEDFVTPEKTNPKNDPQAVRNFSWEDDEVEDSPVRVERVIKARPGTGHQFEFEDDGTPTARKTLPPTKGGVSNKGQGLYKDHVTANDDDEGTAHGDNRPLSDVTKVVKNKNRSKDFGAHWEMNDNTPVGKSSENRNPGQSHQATKSNFGFYDESPQPAYKINIAGNGMGNRAGTQFSLFDDEPEPAVDDRSIGNHKGIQAAGDGMGGRKGADKSFWDF